MEPFLHRIPYFPSGDKLTIDHFFGIAILGVLCFQGVLGKYHHQRFVLEKPIHRRWFTHLHLWLGRTLILCGLANCGFGLLLANVASKWAIIWWIGSGVLALTYLGVSLIVKVIRKRARRKQSEEQFGTVAYNGVTYSTADGHELSGIQPYSNYVPTPGNRPSTPRVYPETNVAEQYWQGGQYDPPIRYDVPGRYNSPYGSRQHLVD